MKIYIVGAVASGKTTLAKKISTQTGIDCTHLDEIIYYKNPESLVWGNTRKSDNEIEKAFAAILHGDRWIIEDSGRKIFDTALKDADTILHLCPNSFTRKKRILLRYMKQKIGVENSLYTPSINMVKQMFEWTRNYDLGYDDLQSRLEQYKDKVVELRSPIDIHRYMSTIT